MDNDITERAMKYADEHNREVYSWDDLCKYRIEQQARLAAYAAGAEDQKVIDDAKWLKIKASWEKQAQITHDDEANYKQGYHDAIEKACDWLKKNFEYYVDVEVSSYYTYEDKLVEDFRKAMEE